MRHDFSRIRTLTIAGMLCALMLATSAMALGVDDLSSKDTASGLKEALTKGAEVAVGQLGKTNGFLGDKRVKIPLPESAQAVEKMMRTFGMKKQADELIETMNRAAEMAVVEAKPILTNAVKSMSFDDARGILTGGDDAATQYFKRTTSKDIGAKFLPIVKQATDQVGLAKQYNSFAGQAASFGAIDAKSANIENYVTEEALDGLFTIIAEQEASIRDNPAAAATSLAKKVFGAN